MDRFTRSGGLDVPGSAMFFALHPNDAGAHLRRARMFAARGMLPDAILAAQQAAALDPRDPEIWWRLGTFHNATGRVDLARLTVATALELTPGHAGARLELGLCDYYEGNLNAAQHRLEGAGDQKERRFGEALVRYALGDRTGSDEALSAFLELGGEPVAIAEVHAQRLAGGRGTDADLEAVHQWLRQAYAQHDPGLERVKYSPLLQPVRDHPEYAALLVQLKLPIE